MALADGHVFTTSDISKELTEYSMANIWMLTHLSTEQIRWQIKNNGFPASKKSWTMCKRGGELKRTRRERWDKIEVDEWYANFCKEEKNVACGLRSK